MSLAVDITYAIRVSGLLNRFVRKQHDLFLFACPLCGDNPKKRGRAGNLYKARGGDSLRFHCYRCGESLWLRDFLERVDPALASEYQKECKEEWFDRHVKPISPPQQSIHSYEPCTRTMLKNCPSISALPNGHPAKAYVLSRQIPPAFHDVLFWTEDFSKLAQSIRSDGRYDNLCRESRLIIPFFDESYQFVALQGRSLDTSAAVRYITIKVHDDAPKVYGFHRGLDRTLAVYVTEGPFDSMFLPNCLSIGGSDVPSALSLENTVLVYDNEPRKQQTVDKMVKAVENGLRVCVWPEHITEKDINEIVLGGRDPSLIKDLIDECTYKGRTAIRRINEWKRV